MRLMPLAGVLLALLAPLAGARAPAAPSAQIASSAMLVLDASINPGEIVLHITRTAGAAPVEGAGNVSAAIDGHPVPLLVQGNAYALDTRDIDGGAHTLQVIVAHDGIHEVLSAVVTLPKRASRFAVLEQHGYGAWWVLNIVVMLLAARLIMRRKKPPASRS
jgi:hypothetical protein